MENKFDVAVIGGGPAGLTASIYLVRARLKAVLFEKHAPGGQVLMTDKIENYPGYPEGITGYELMEKMKQQAVGFGLEIRNEEIRNISGSGTGDKLIETNCGNKYLAGSLIIATGAKPKKLGIKGEELFIGKGISYCATCDGAFFRGKKIAVVGGGDRAIEEALFLTRFTDNVIVIHRREQLRAVKILQERMFKNTKIKFIKNSIVTEIGGHEKVDYLKIRDLETSEEQKLQSDGVFIAIGFIPETQVVAGIVKLDKDGYIECDQNMSTSVPGIYACGDCCRKQLRQIITACGDGANAAYSAQKHLEGNK